MSELIMLFAVVVLLAAWARLRRARQFDKWNHDAICGYQRILKERCIESAGLKAKLADAETINEFQQSAIEQLETTNKSMVSIVRDLQAELDKANRSRSALRGQITKLRGKR